LARCLLVLEAQARRPLEEDHPFVRRLVVPEAVGRALPAGDDPLDPGPGDRRELLEDLVRRSLGGKLEEIAGGGMHQNFSLLPGGWEMVDATDEERGAASVLQHEQERVVGAE